jgi:ABC-type amino acid transport substrate-binding protein
MRITPLAKAFITLVVLGVMGYAFWYQRRATTPAPRGEASVQPAAAPSPAASPAEGAAVGRIKARGALLVGMDTGEPPWTGTPPMYFPDQAGRPDGFDFALATHLARALGASEAKVVHAKYSELPDRLRQAGPDAIDVLISGYAPAPQEGIAWSDAYLEYGLCLVVPAASKVRTVADLFGKPVGIFDDEAAAEAVNRLVKGYTGLVRLEDGYWDQLLQGRFAGFVYDYPYAAAEIAAFYRQNPHRKGAFRIAQYNLTDSTYAVGVRRSEPDLLAVVNRAIAAWRESDGYRAAIRRYLGGGQSIDAPAAAGRTVEVRPGDTLSLIARRELGADARWREVWEKNKSRFPNPHLIEVGDKVVLP